jgi:hypothetical protein
VTSVFTATLLLVGDVSAGILTVLVRLLYGDDDGVTDKENVVDMVDDAAGVGVSIVGRPSVLEVMAAAIELVAAMIGELVLWDSCVVWSAVAVTPFGQSAWRPFPRNIRPIKVAGLAEAPWQAEFTRLNTGLRLSTQLLEHGALLRKSAVVQSVIGVLYAAVQDAENSLICWKAERVMMVDFAVDDKARSKSHDHGEVAWESLILSSPCSFEKKSQSRMVLVGFHGRKYVDGHLDVVV